jgi:fused signal recognition particle receptor
MFDGLKKKLSGVIKAFSKEEEAEIVGRREAGEKAVAAVQPEVARTGHKAAKGSEDGIKISSATKIKGAIFGSVRLSGSDIAGFLDMLKVSMLESDVSYDDTEEFLNRLGKSLSELKVDSKNMRGELMGSVRSALLGIISKTNGININAFISERIMQGNAPVKILFLGSNGTGKTTTIAKVAHMLKARQVSAVISASDTFRAAAIEQTEYHANALHVPVIKSKYGADPASVAFDAVAYAKAHSIQVVLIDSAGRQETNRNLINEMQKMDRVVKPDVNIYVGESTSGNAIVSQVKEFLKSIRIDGIILTKLDCDAKGGGAISIANSTGIPILFLGTGESYGDLVPYDPDIILDAMLPDS